MLPSIRKRLYEMCIRNAAEGITDSNDPLGLSEEDGLSEFKCWEFDSISLGDNEQFFQVFNDVLNLANTNAVNLSFCNVIVLRRVIKKARRTASFVEFEPRSCPKQVLRSL